MNNSLMEKIRIKKAMRISKADRCPTFDPVSLKRISQEVKIETLSLKKKHFSNRVEENKNNPNKLWKIIKEISPSNFSRKEDPIELPEATLNSLNEHFASTGKRIQ